MQCHLAVWRPRSKWRRRESNEQNDFSQQFSDTALRNEVVPPIVSGECAGGESCQQIASTDPPSFRYLAELWPGHFLVVGPRTTPPSGCGTVKSWQRGTIAASWASTHPISAQCFHSSERFSAMTRARNLKCFMLEERFHSFPLPYRDADT